MDIDNRCVKSGNYYTLNLVTPIAQSSVKQKAVEVISGGDISCEIGSATLISEGYYNGTRLDTSDNIVISPTEESGYYKLAVGSEATITRNAVTRQVTAAGYLDEELIPQVKIPATVIESDAKSAGFYIKKSTINETTISPSGSTQIVTIGDGYFPTDRTITINPVVESFPTTSVTSTGMATYFYSSNESNYDISVTPKYSNNAGFVANHDHVNNGGIEYYRIKHSTITEGKTSLSGSSVQRGTISWTGGWVDNGGVNPAAFKNTPTTGKNYVDISNTTESPVLISGDYLYIDSGYVDDLKISLAKLVPDESSVNIRSDKILNGYTAFNGDGMLITGTVETYDGSYTLT